MLFSTEGEPEMKMEDVQPTAGPSETDPRAVCVCHPFPTTETESDSDVV